MSKSYTLLRLQEAEQELASVQYRIANLQQFYSCHQIRVWKTQRKNLNAKIKTYRAMLKESHEGMAGRILRDVLKKGS